MTNPTAPIDTTELDALVDTTFDSLMEEDDDEMTDDELDEIFAALMGDDE